MQAIFCQETRGRSSIACKLAGLWRAVLAFDVCNTSLGRRIAATLIRWYIARACYIAQAVSSTSDSPAREKMREISMLITVVERTDVPK